MTALIPNNFGTAPAPYREPAAALDANFSVMFPEVANFAALRAITDTSGVIAVWVRGGVTNNDGQQGIFSYDATDTTSADNNGTIIVGTSGFRWKRWITNAVSVKWFGAKGDNTTDDILAIQAAVDFAYGPATAPHGTNTALNYPLYFPPGNYRITSPVRFTSIRGGDIFGAGRWTSSVINTAGGDCFDFNGYQYGVVRSLYLSSSGTTATVCNIDWTGTGLSTQSVTFYDCFFNGGNVGPVIGASGLQASEITFIDCFIANAHTYALTVNNFNAVGNNWYGGNIQSCPTGIRCFAGTINVYGCGFQGSTVWDFQSDSSANDAITISGCRTESLNFVWVQNHMTLHLSACSQINNSNGQFVRLDGQGQITACTSTHGTVGGALIAEVAGCVFGRNDYIGNLLSSAYWMRVINVTYNNNATAIVATDRSYTDAGGGAVNPFPGNYSPIQDAFAVVNAAGGNARIAIPPNVVVSAVRLDIYTAGAAGSINVGDDSSATAYFNGQALTGAGTFVSTTAATKYGATGGQLLLSSTASTGLDAAVHVQFSFLT